MSTQRKSVFRSAVISASIIAATNPAGAAESDPIFVAQGSSWTSTARASFYTQDQGSRIMPLSGLTLLSSPMARRFWLTV
jgi:hypothetical protein